VFYHNGGLQWRDSHVEIPRALFRNICHWKSPRRFRDVCDNDRDIVSDAWREALELLGQQPFQDEAVRLAVARLTQLDGVEVRMASALLTAWNPLQFGVFDVRVVNVLGLPERYSAQDYVDYRRRLLDLKDELPELRRCALRQIELALWHFYAVQETGDRERPD
jgi:SpoVK/Ycf46/Vps4 family AAA+-type ATPase